MRKEKIRVQDFLAALPMFNDLAPAELDQLASSTQEMKVNRGARIFSRGDPCIGFHTVVYGQVKLSFVSPGGVEKVVEIIGPGYSFGEALMFMEKPYIVSADALDDSLLLHVSKAAVFDMLDHDPRFSRKMLAGLSRRLHGLICDVEAYSLRSGAQRVIGYLLKDDKLADGDSLRLPVSKAVIASRLNLTPEHFSRILHELVDGEMIAVDGKSVTILDVEKLRAY